MGACGWLAVITVGGRKTAAGVAVAAAVAAAAVVAGNSNTPAS